MARIGELYRVESKWSGYVATLAFEIELRLDDNPDIQTEESPAFIVKTRNGKIELGAAWKRETREGKKYLSMVMDHPGWPAVLNVAAFPDKDNPDHAAILWNRAPAKAVHEPAQAA